MSTTISAGTATSGAALSSDTSGILQLQSGSTPTTAVTIDTAQNVGVGVTPPTIQSTFSNLSIGYAANFLADKSSVGGLNILQNAYRNTGGTYTYVGTAPSTYYQQYNGTHAWYTAPSGTGGTGITFTSVFSISQLGDFVTGTAANSPYNNTTGNAANININSLGQLYRSTSSAKYKTNIQTATFGLADVLKLRPVTYQSKNTEVDGTTTFGGLVAEEVDAAGLKEFVQYATDGTPDALAYGNMVSLCIKAIQELSAKVTALEAKVGV